MLGICMAAAPDATTALVSLHVNDCTGTACGSVCAGGERAGLSCLADWHCPDSFCDLSTAHQCTSEETRDNVKFIVDSLLAASYQRVIFWRSPGSIHGLEVHRLEIPLHAFLPGLDRLIIQ